MRIVGPPDRQLTVWEQQIEDATRQALRQVMNRIADRITGSLTAALVAHLPGKHDQSSHGKGGGSAGGGVRGSLASAKTTSEVNTAAAAEAKAITGRDITFELGGDPQIAREHAEGVLRVVERYPEADVMAVRTAPLAGLDPNGGTPYAMIQGSNVVFSAEFSNDPAGYHASLAKAEATGWYRSGHATPMAIGIHEAGHQTGPAWETGPRAGQIALEHIGGRRRQAGESWTTEDLNNEVAADLGWYATTNGMELTTIAVTDVLLRGESASAMSREITEMNDAEYRKITGT